MMEKALTQSPNGIRVIKGDKGRGRNWEKKAAGSYGKSKRQRRTHPNMVKLIPRFIRPGYELLGFYEWTTFRVTVCSFAFLLPSISAKLDSSKKPFYPLMRPGLNGLRPGERNWNKKNNNKSQNNLP
ncbi:hypothetical protein RUM44_003285 [Polyplax serrata]|uniref:Uncharacterized protein n=1 Tax=Polyplax serrata TaxID=468196 RepID=A0ABR1AG53_POLSC